MLKGFSKKEQESLGQVLRMIAENRTPVTTMVKLDTRRTTYITTRLGPDLFSIQKVSGRRIVLIPIGSHTEISTRDDRFVVDDMRPRDGHTAGVLIRSEHGRHMIEPQNKLREIPLLGTVVYRKSDW